MNDVQNWKLLKSFKVKDYKCFPVHGEYQGFDELKSMNVIIGKNNSGKSKLLEVISDFINNGTKYPAFPLKLTEKPLISCLLKIPTLSEGIIKRFLRSEEIFHYNQEKNLRYHNIVFKAEGGKLLDRPPSAKSIGESYSASILQKIFDQKDRTLINPFYNYRYYHIAAERDVSLEEKSNSSLKGIQDTCRQNARNKLDLAPSGKNLTMFLARCLTDTDALELKDKKGSMRDFIENDFLDYINDITAPDITFSRISASQHNNNLWEIYLDEEKKGSIKLSDCGSGLKTIIFTLFLLHVVPKITDSDRNVFAFEELENNLHPDAEKKLLKHIRDYAREHQDSLFFFTTHSHIAINLFAKNQDAQILQASNKDGMTTIKTIFTNDEKVSLLSDLGIEASDILQTNCIIWVEGPSDRIYVKKWIDLYHNDLDGNDTLEEGVHYQFLFFGGSNIASHSADDEDHNIGEFIEIAKICRHSYIIVDRDKDTENGEELKPALKRILEEQDQLDNLKCWITEGKEVENYLTKEIVENYFDRPFTKAQWGNKKDFAKLYKKYKNKEKILKNFPKVKFAKEITLAEYYTRDNLLDSDLEDRAKELICFIRSANPDLKTN